MSKKSCEMSEEILRLEKPIPDEGLRNSVEPQQFVLVFHGGLPGAGECSAYTTG